MATDQLTAACLSPSGELVALGGSGGYVHTWAETANPRVNAAAGGAGGGGKAAGGGALPMPPARRPRPTVELRVSVLALQWKYIRINCNLQVVTR